MEPLMFCDDRRDQTFQTLERYVRVVRDLAIEFDAVLVPFQSRIGEQIQNVSAEKWLLDSVHPHVWAHARIAQRYLKSTRLYQSRSSKNFFLL
jgi:hypothetical protein